MKGWVRMGLTPQHYEPTLESVRRHPLPDWYQDAKLGIFVHWGLYSVPGWAASRKDPFSIIAEGGFDRYFRENPYAEWYLNTLKFNDGRTRAYHDRTFGEDFVYEDFQPIFESEARKWVPEDWAKLFQKAGADYVVLTAKHTDGYLLWPSQVGNLARPTYKSRRDLVGEFVAAARARGLHAGLYYSGGMDWLLNPQRIDAPGRVRQRRVRQQGGPRRPAQCRGGAARQDGPGYGLVAPGVRVGTGGEAAAASHQRIVGRRHLTGRSRPWGVAADSAARVRHYQFP